MGWLDERPEIAYLCDFEKCRCSDCLDNYMCEHTTDVRYARDFEEVEPGKFIQQRWD
jgi:hypothetical protein